jgi:NADPH-dependent 7-cyano-7-deazaguanine reductase QueF
MDLLDIGCTIKILSYISKRLTTTLLRADASLVRNFHELYLSMNRCTHRILGDFNPGVQPRGTPITAEVVDGGDVNINVIWRDAQGRAVTSSWSKSLGWDSNRDGGRAPLDGRD